MECLWESQNIGSGSFFSPYDPVLPLVPYIEGKSKYGRRQVRCTDPYSIRRFRNFCFPGGFLLLRHRRRSPQPPAALQKGAATAALGGRCRPWIFHKHIEYLDTLASSLARQQSKLEASKGNSQRRIRRGGGSAACLFCVQYCTPDLILQSPLTFQLLNFEKGFRVRICKSGICKNMSMIL